MKQYDNEGGEGGREGGKECVIHGLGVGLLGLMF